MPGFSLIFPRFSANQHFCWCTFTHAPPSPTPLYDTVPPFVYVDQLLCHCIFICSDVNWCCNLSVGVALIVWFTTNGMCEKNNNIHMRREQAIIEWSWRVNSIVACCHSVKLCALATRAFRSQHWQLVDDFCSLLFCLLDESYGTINQSITIESSALGYTYWL